MAAKILEIPESRHIHVSGDNPTASLEFRVWDTFDELEVHALVFAVVAPYYYGLIFIDADYQHQGGGLWNVPVNYGQRAPLTPVSTTPERPTGPGAMEGGGQAPGSSSGQEGQGYEISFDIAGESGHITQARGETVYDAAGVVDPGDFSFHEAIGQKKDDVEGLDFETGVFSWTETHRIPVATLVSGYLAVVYGLFNRVNNDTFRNFAHGEVRFLGASGSWHGTEASAPIQFKFQARPNETDIVIGDITVTAKQGQEYLWIDYDVVEEGTGDKKKTIRKPLHAVVNKIYLEGDFSLLGIGT